MQSTDPSRGSNAPQPGWYPDPWQLAPTRWWDGITWTGFTTPAPRIVAPVAPLAPVAPFAPVARNNARSDAFARDDISGGGIAILGYFGAVALALIFSEVAASAGATAFSVPGLVASSLGLWTGLCMAAYIVSHRRPGGTITDLGFRMPTRHEVGLGIGIGFAGLLVATRVVVLLRHMFPDDSSSHLGVAGTPSFAAVMVFGALACLGAPIVEELFFRGVVQPVLARNLGTTPAIIMQAMLFGLAHFNLGMTFNQAAVRCGTVMVLGVCLGWLRFHTGRLGAGMVAHATNNFIVTLVMFAALAAR